MITLRIMSTYDANGCLMNHVDYYERQVDLNELPSVLLELAQHASDIHSDQELVITFPTNDPTVMGVEIYNGYRE